MGFITVKWKKVGIRTLPRADCWAILSNQDRKTQDMEMMNNPIATITVLTKSSAEMGEPTGRTVISEILH